MKQPGTARPNYKEAIMAEGKDRLKPGEKTPHSGLYEQVGPRGGHTGETVVSEQGNPLPPTDEPGQGWVLDTPSGKK